MKNNVQGTQKYTRKKPGNKNGRVADSQIEKFSAWRAKKRKPGEIEEE